MSTKIWKIGNKSAVKTATTVQQFRSIATQKKQPLVTVCSRKHQKSQKRKELKTEGLEMNGNDLKIKAKTASLPLPEFSDSDARERI